MLDHATLLLAGEHLQHDDDQLSEGGRAERHAVLGHLLHLLRLRGALRVRRHPPPDEGRTSQSSHFKHLSDLTGVTAAQRKKVTNA